MKMRFSLMEAVHYSGLLTESQRRDFVVKTYGPQIIAAFSRHYHAADTIEGLRAIPVMDHDPEDQQAANNALAAQIVDYVATFDPTPKKIYTLWMCQRIMKGELSFDDLAGVQYYLQVFEANKNRIQLKDIGQYKTIEQLAQVVSQFEEKSAPAETLTNDKNMQVVYDSGNVQIVIPKSIKGATILGQDTIWCTAWPGARNRFQYYEDGVIYVIIDKAKKARWQFFIPSNKSQTAAEFMDRANRPIDLSAFFQSYPMAFKVIGEDKLAPWMDKIGISMFSDAVLKRLPVENIPRVIHSVEDLKRFPQDAVLGETMARQILAHAQKSAGFEGLVQFYLDAGKFRDEFWMDTATRYLHAVFPLLPDRFQTDANKIEMVENFRGQIYLNIKEYIKQPWPKAVTQSYWDSRTSNDVNLTISEIPDEFRNDEVIANVLRRNPSEMLTYPNLTEDAVIGVLQKSSLDNAKYIPERLKTRRVFDYLEMHIPHHQSYGVYAHYQNLATFPTEMWTNEMAPHLLTARDDLTYDDLPGHIRNEKNMVAWLASQPTKLLTMPKEAITVAMLARAALDYSASYKEVVKQLTPDRVTPQLFEQALRVKINSYYLTDVYSVLPDYLKTDGIMRLFMERSIVPIKEMGSLINARSIISRVRNNVEEISDIPENQMSSDLAARFVEQNYRAIERIKDRYLTEDVLFSWLHGVQANRHEAKLDFMASQFARFDKKIWTSRCVAEAIDLGLIPAEIDAIPSHLVDSATIAAVVRYNPDALEDERSSSIEEDNLVEAISKNAQVLNRIKPENMTEPMAYAALQSHAGTCKRSLWLGGENGYSDSKDFRKEVVVPIEAALARIPKRLYSRRCWFAAVCYTEPLSKVPTRFLDDKMITEALRRDPRQIVALENPAKWMTENGKSMLGEKLQDRNFVAHINQVGIFKLGREWLDANDLERKPIGDTGYSFVYVRSQSNYRAYLFDKKGKIVFDMWSKDDKIKTERGSVVAKHAKAINQMVVENRGSFTMGDADVLRDADIFAVGYGGSRSLKGGQELTLQKLNDGDKLRWTKGTFSIGAVHMAYVGDSHSRPVLRIEEQQNSGGYQNRGGGKSYIREVTNYVPEMKLRAMSMELAGAFNQLKLRGDYRARNFGLYQATSDVWYSLAHEKLAEAGELSVWRGEGGASNRVTVYHTILGYLGGAKILKNGTIKDLELASESKDLAGPINKLIETIAKSGKK